MERDVRLATEDRPAAVDSVAGLAERLAAAVEALKVEAKERTAAARELAKVAKPGLLGDLKKLEKAHTRLQEKLSQDQAARCGVAAVLRALAEHVQAAPDRIRREVGRELKQACVREGHEFRVVSREEPIEVRIPPLAVILDFKKSRAILQYARDPITTCRLTAEDIVKAHETTVKSLDSGFQPDAHFERFRKAYLRVLRMDGLNDGDRVEIVRFLPELAFLSQSKRFHENPTARNFRPYTKAKFAYDVYRLRQAGGLTRGGLRLNFGVATGITATKKNRVTYMEDPFGVGEYKLTVFFTKT